MKLTASCYLQLEPLYDRSGRNYVGFKIVRLTQQTPDSQLGGTILAKLRFTIPTAAFDPLLVASIELPEDGYAITPLVEVERTDGEDEPST